MAPATLPPHGRGAPSNPANRFERLHVVSELPTPDRIETLYLRDTSRTILARNDSPDVGFDVSINPYRGCEHGCSYCSSGDTPILLADGSWRRLDQLKVGDDIYGTVRHGFYRRYVRTKVLAHWCVERAAHRVSLEDGTTLIASGDHRFLTERGWKFVAKPPSGGGQRPHLTPRNKLMGTGAFAVPPDTVSSDYRRGYLCGMVRGDGLLATYRYERAGRARGDQHHFRLALTDTPGLDRVAVFLADFGVGTRRVDFQAAAGNRRAMQALRTQSRPQVERIRELVQWPSAPCDAWLSGYLAGIFDAEGSYSGGVLRISNTDERIVAVLRQALKRFGFSFALEAPHRNGGRPIQVVRLLGGLRESLRFWHTVDNAILRKRELAGQALKSTARLRVAEVEPLGRSMPLFDITTGTGDFIANGVVSHNCYARPTHEYLGFSAGLDFESRILVKEEAPELLRRELASPRWEPQVIALSGVTDPYQPVERKLGLTRRCLEVLAECRNPVAVTTKSALVMRDTDLLAGLARYDAAAVAVSVTTLDGELARRLEPRAAHPRERLRAIRHLAASGVPVGVSVAPVIPGLTDHEIPAILQAAAAAGARFAAWVLLRLPGAVAGIFEEWLEAHVPERKDKILSRLRALRGGRLYDPRFGVRGRGEGIFAEQIRALFETGLRRAGIPQERPRLSTAAFRRPGEAQLGLFDR